MKKLFCLLSLLFIGFTFSLNKSVTHDRTGTLQDYFSTPRGIDANTVFLAHYNSWDYSATPQATDLDSTEYASISTSEFKFNSLSFALTKSGSYVTTPSINTADFDIASNITDSWTVEWWYKAYSTLTNPTAFFKNYQDSNDYWYIYYAPTDDFLNYRQYDNSTGSETTIYDATTSNQWIESGSWQHFAFIKVGAVRSFYVDGQQYAYLSDNDTDTYRPSYFRIGYSGTSMYGWIDEVRVSSANVYNASPNSGKNDSFAPPTSALTADENTTFFLSAKHNYDVKNHIKIADANTPNCDVDIKKFGSASQFFSTNEQTIFKESSDWDVFASNTSDCTIDFWVRPVAANSNQGYVSHYADTSNSWNIMKNTDNTITFVAESSNTTKLTTTSAATIAAGEWSWITLVKKGSIYALYINGTQSSYTEDSDTVNINCNTSNGLRIGNGGSGTVYFANAHLDEIRIQASNIFEVTPTAELTSTIPVPTSEYR